MKRIILIPSYEPDNKLIKLVNDLNKEEVDIIVINDGSNETFNNIFKSIENKVHLISYEDNKGKGYALKEGLKYIKDKYKEDYLIITMDSDGQHTIKDAKRLIEYIENNQNVLAIGKRLRDKKIPLRSKIGNGITKFVFFLTTGVKVYDTQSGLRCFTDKLIDYMLNVDGNRFEYEMNVLMMCAKNKIKMKEIVIETIYIDNNSGSHFNKFKDSYLIYKNIFKNLFKRRMKWILQK